jgi:hypothetical protein
MKTLWTFGCSFTAEYYPVGHHTIKSTYDDYKKWKGYLPEIWPTLLGKKLNCRVENKGKGGDSNYGILDQFFSCHHLIKESDIVIFGWTNVIRFKAANPLIDQFNQLLPAQFDCYQDTGMSVKTIEEIFINRTHPLWLDEVHNWVKFINSFMEKSGVNVYHWTSDENIFGNEEDFIDKSKFIIPPYTHATPKMILGYLSQPHYYDNQFKAKIIEETNGEINDCHFGEHGHKVQSEYFYDHIINNLQYPTNENRD